MTNGLDSFIKEKEGNASIENKEQRSISKNEKKKRSGGKKQKRSRRYIPGLAAFTFRPTHDWSVEEATRLFETTHHDIQPFRQDTIQYMDCLEGLQRLPKNSVDLVIADPPFGLDFTGKEHIYNRDKKFVVEGYTEVSREEYLEFSRRWLTLLPRVMKSHASAYIFSGWTNLESILTAAREAGLHLVNHVIWKYQFGVFTRRKFVTSHYHVLFLVKNQRKYFFNKIEHYPLDVWEINRTYRFQQQKNGTVLPVELIARCIDFSSKPGDLVLDPFMGNGTTAVAALQNLRHFFGFEINESLKPVIESNLSMITPGETYRPYSDRLPSIEELKEKYPQAYKLYMEQQHE